jgi:hypothetical protein
MDVDARADIGPGLAAGSAEPKIAQVHLDRLLQFACNLGSNPFVADRHDEVEVGAADP